MVAMLSAATAAAGALVPEGYVERRAFGVRLWARRGYEDRIAHDLRHSAAAAGTGSRGRAEAIKLAARNGAPSEWAVLRHYWRGGLLGPILRDLHLSWRRPFGEVALYERARRAGVPTLEPLGAIARRAGPLPLYRLDLVTRLVEGARNLADLYVNDALDRASPMRRRAHLEAAGRSVRALHDAGILHADLNLGNLLAVEAPASGVAPAAAASKRLGQPSVLVIDLDRSTMKDLGAPASAARLENLYRLYRSGEKTNASIERRAITKADVRRFGRGYFGDDRASIEAAASALAAYHRTRLRLHRAFWRT